MKRIALLTTLLLTLSIGLPAAAAASYSGSITAGQPGTLGGAGITEVGAACDPSSDLNGIDGVWFDIADDDGTNFTLTMDATLDADLYFYDADCVWIDNSIDGAEGGLGVTEDGAVPADAAFAIVDGFAGSGAFTLTLD